MCSRKRAILPSFCEGARSETKHFFLFAKRRKKKLSPFQRESETSFSSPPSSSSSSPRYAGQRRTPPGRWPLRHRRQWKPPQRRPRRRCGLDPVFESFELDVDQTIVVAVVSLPFDRHGHPESPRRKDPGAAGEGVYRKRLELKEIESQRKLSEAPLLARMKMTKKTSSPFRLCWSSPYRTRSSTPSFARD